MAKPAKMAVYRPCAGLAPVPMEKAMAVGRAMKPMVMPASRSRLRSADGYPAFRRLTNAGSSAAT